MLEWYEAYADYEDIAARLEELVAYVADEVGYEGPIDFSPPWRRVTLRDAIKEETGVDIACATRRAVAAARGTLGPQRRGRPALQARRAQARAARPSSSTTRRSCRRSPRTTAREPGLVERFECFAGGMEFANAFTELNDPDEQRARFEQQRADQAAGDEETQPYDEDYVARAGAGHAAHRRHRHRHRPAGDAPQRPRARSARSCSSRRCATSDRAQSEFHGRCRARPRRRDRRVAAPQSRRPAWRPWIARAGGARWPYRSSSGSSALNSSARSGGFRRPSSAACSRARRRTGRMRGRSSGAIRGTSQGRQWGSRRAAAGSKRCSPGRIVRVRSSSSAAAETRADEKNGQLAGMSKARAENPPIPTCSDGIYACIKAGLACGGRW